MKYIQCIFTIILVLLLLFNGGVDILAVDMGFSTESMSEDEIETFLKNVNISILENEPSKKAIDCFDVNENGEIAIGSSDFENQTVCVYTNDGDFISGYSFECTGNFGIELDKDVINLYFVRSDVAVTINPTGEIERVCRIQNTAENNSYWNNCVFATKRRIGDTEYTLKNDMKIFNVFASSYSQLITTSQNGEESIIYDVNSAEFVKTALAFTGVLIFVGLVVSVVISQFIKLKRRAKTS